MIKNNKKGVTMASLAVYVVLFSIFTVFVSTISTNVNERLFDNRGEAINYSNLGKLQYNLEASASSSTDVLVAENQISYSNGDNYIYDETKNTIFKNGGILCPNVEEFEVSLETGVKTKKVNVQISFNKYLNTMTRSIISCVEESI